MWFEIHWLGVLQKSMMGCSCTCSRAHPFSVSRGNGWTDCAETLCMASKPLAMCFSKDGGYLQERTCNGLTFKYIHPLSLVHRPKGVLLVLKIMAVIKVVICVSNECYAQYIPIRILFNDLHFFSPRLPPKSLSHTCIHAHAPP